MQKAKACRLRGEFRVVVLLCIGYLTARSAVSGVIHADFKWNKTQLTVCFAKAKQRKLSRLYAVAKASFQRRPSLISFRAEEKRAIAEAITREYTPERTLIHFTGWEDCDAQKPADVWIYLSSPDGDMLDSAASIGMDSWLVGLQRLKGPENEPEKYALIREKRPGQKPAYVLLNRPGDRGLRLDPRETLQLHAIHEFGHIAGLVHEHNLPDADRDPNCHLTRTGQSPYLEATATLSSSYDPNSVMSYCFATLLREVSGLRFSTVGRASESIEDGTSPVFYYPKPNVVDPGLIEEKTVLPARTEYRLRIGLSRGDIHALRCLYASPADYDLSRCRASFDVYSP